MGFLQVLAYFVLNFLGFLGFNEVWKRIQKPPPIDYTTIPGLKHAELAETRAAICIDSTMPLIKVSPHRGCIDSLAALSATPLDCQLSLLLSDLQTYFGPVASLFIGPRYVVALSTATVINQLKQYENSRKSSVCPFAWASVIIGDQFFWEFNQQKSYNNKIKQFLNIEKQTELILKYPESGNTFYNNSDDDTDMTDSNNVTTGFNKNNEQQQSEWLRKCMPCFVYAYEEEIDINGHKIPPCIPILINLASLNIDERLFWLRHSGFNDFVTPET